MYEITSSIYLELAERLVSEIGDKEFYSGVVVCYDGEVRCRFVATLIVRRGEVLHNDRRVRTIVGIVPVWWEFEASVGEEVVEDDFAFEVLRDAIMGH